ncbi:serine hydrolase [Micromonospora sp. WMMA1363]|uniref:D-alanyl-D-alanine carboxypeptidase family protein n=1 Tax=Micromonospora sp. WMMA1363 TaxID=3053985 RepID=UPI00259CDF48|nr:serine hydrolase [Micromonospora sp. WMMA1363]MDM4719902.1 serine hydrolase [Micromonospora sp. WMMA1363]
MSTSRIVATALGVALVVPAVAVVPPTRTAAAQEVPCPRVAPPVPPPATPAPPPVDLAERTVGGDALATAGLAVPPDVPTPPAVTATAWVVADLNGGGVLGGCAPHERRRPASVQKLLLAAALMPDLDPQQVVEVEREDLADLDPDSSLMGVVEGGRYSIENLWQGVLLVSGNDAANVLARVGGDGRRQGGVDAMNDEAQRLRANQTHAVTPSGLDAPGQYTSAYDLALIARATFAREDFRRYVETRVATVPAQRGKPAFEITNNNTLLDRYPGMLGGKTGFLGGKTGFTALARETYVGVAERDGRRLAVTLLGAETEPLGRMGEAVALLDWGFTLPADVSAGRLVGPEDRKSPSALLAGLGLTAAAAVVVMIVVFSRRRSVSGRPTGRR